MTTAQRWLFLIDKQGMVRGQWRGTATDVFPSEPILKMARELRGTREAPARAARRRSRIERAGRLLGLLALAGPALSASPAPAQPGALELSRSPQTRPPEFRGRTVEGQAVSLAELGGRVVLLNFWATWCLECRPEMPGIERLYREFGPQGLTVMAINAREGIAAAEPTRRSSA